LHYARKSKGSTLYKAGLQILKNAIAIWWRPIPLHCAHHINGHMFYNAGLQTLDNAIAIWWRPIPLHCAHHINGHMFYFTGRQTLENAIAMVEAHPKWGAHVVYGDTDSMFVHLPVRQFPLLCL
jgi:hypothetical protein